MSRYVSDISVTVKSARRRSRAPRPAVRILERMKVVLPDSTELELPDGATGPRRRARDRAEARRAGGARPLERRRRRTCGCRSQDGQPIQILTTRDKDDPDALYVLRHSSAHLLAEAVRRLYPGVKIAIGPPIEQRLLLRLRVPRADRRGRPRADRGGGPARARRGPRVGARGDRPPTRPRARFEAEGEPYKVELVDTAEGAISLYAQSHDGGERVHRPLPRPAPPELGADQGVQAHRPRRRLLARRRAQQAADAHLRHGVLLAGRSRRAPRAARGGTRARPPPPRHAARPLPLLRASRPGSPFWHPKGMVIWNVLEDLRRRENVGARLRRGADAAALRQGARRVPRATGRSTASTCSRSSHEEHDRRVRAEADELPGPLLLYARGASATASCRCGSPRRASLHRDELTGALHGLLRVRMFSQDDAHIFCTPEQIEDEVLGCLEFGVRDLRPASGSRSRSSSRRGPRTSSAPTRNGTRPRRRSRAALERRGIEYAVNEGDGAFYGPKIDLHMLDSLGRSWQIGTVQLDFQMPQRFGLALPGRRQRRAHAGA